jgi:hypothetical protein
MTEKNLLPKQSKAEIRAIAKAMSGFGQMIQETADSLEGDFNESQAVHLPYTLVHGIGIFLAWGGERLLKLEQNYHSEEQQ